MAARLNWNMRRPRARGVGDPKHKPPKPRTNTRPGQFPPYEPTTKDRQMVKILAGFGLRQEEICLLIVNPSTGRPIAKTTLVDHFRLELDIGMTEADAQVMQSYFRQCVGAPAVYDGQGNIVRKEVEPSVTAQIFWLKARRGWRENINVNVNGAVALGTPQEWAALSDDDLDNAIREEIKSAQLLLAPPKKERR